MKFFTAYKSIKGLREEQQDSYGYLEFKDKAIMAVADGNGGEGGKEISEAAVKAVISYTCAEFSKGNYLSIETKEQLNELGIATLNNACKEILSLKENCKAWEKAGTTIAFVIVTPGLMGTFWIGDSCVYISYLGKLEKVTNPVHTLAEQLIKEGSPRVRIPVKVATQSGESRPLSNHSSFPIHFKESVNFGQSFSMLF